MPIYSETIQNLVANSSQSPKYHFDGANGTEINCGDLGFKTIPTYTDISVAMWINPETITGDDGGWEFYGSPASEFSLGIYSSNYHCKINGTSSNNFNVPAGDPNIWHHVVVTYDGANWKLYEDGILKQTNAFTEVPDLTGRSFYIGTYDNSGYHAQAEYAGVKVFNIALSSSEVIDLHQGKELPFKYKGAISTALLGNSNVHTNNNFASFSPTSGGNISAWSVSALNQYCSTPITALTPGKQYRISFTLDGSMAGGMYFTVANDTNLGSAGGRSNISTSALATGNHEFTFTVSDAFDNIGFYKAHSFSSTETLPPLTNWSFTQIGAVAEYDGSGIASDKWFDKSGNGFHGTVSGATASGIVKSPGGMRFLAQSAITNEASGVSTGTTEKEIVRLSTGTFTAGSKILLVASGNISQQSTSASYYAFSYARGISSTGGSGTSQGDTGIGSYSTQNAFHLEVGYSMTGWYSADGSATILIDPADDVTECTYGLMYVTAQTQTDSTYFYRWRITLFEVYQ